MPRFRSIQLAAGGLLATGWLASCSQPSAAPGRIGDQPTRDVQLVESATPATVGVSDLEAGRPPRPAPETRVRSPKPVADPEPEHPAETVAAPEQAPSASPTEPVAADLVEAPAPSPAAEEDVVVVRAMAIQPTYAVNLNPPLSPRDGRGPIIIRGGMGGVHDTCRKHGPGFSGIPIAINRSEGVRSGIR